MLRREFALQVDAIRKVTLSVDEGHLRVCNIEKPQTGLEVKFSLRATNALALLGENTANDATYSDATAKRGEVVDLCRKIEIATWKKKSHTLSEVAVHLNDGRVVRKEFDVGIPMTDLAAQGTSLSQKFIGLAEPAIGAARARAGRRDQRQARQRQGRRRADGAGGEGGTDCCHSGARAQRVDPGLSSVTVSEKRGWPGQARP